MSQLLTPDQLFPAHSSDIAQQFVDLPSGIRLRVAEAGPRDGRPVVLIHGWGASMYMYRHALDALPRLGMRTIAVDLRGFGLSSRPVTRRAYSLDEYIGDLLALLDLLELSNPAIIGQSMGGGLTLRFALRCTSRVSKIVLINPSSLVPLRFLPIVRTLPRAVVVALGGRLVPRWAVAFTLRRVAYGDPNAVTDQDIDEYWSPTQLPGYTAAARAALSDFDWSVVSNEDAGQLAVPTLVMLGKSDRLIANTERAARRLNGAHVRSLAGGHCVHEENPVEAYRLIGEFLERDSIK
ncbi:MAG TPA: alpha/beta hydrolase [Gemmatimonadaceae bacterium]